MRIDRSSTDFKLRVGDIVETHIGSRFLITGYLPLANSPNGDIYLAATHGRPLAWTEQGLEMDGSPVLAAIVGGITR